MAIYKARHYHPASRGNLARFADGCEVFEAASGPDLPDYTIFNKQSSISDDLKLAGGRTASWTHCAVQGNQLPGAVDEDEAHNSTEGDTRTISA
jgi:hypothetical protein